MVIFQEYGCDSKHVKSVPVHEVFQGKTVWRGKVEVFDLIHYRAKRCYGWMYGEPEEFMTILEGGRVTDAQSAVKVRVSYRAEASFRLRPNRDKTSGGK